MGALSLAVLSDYYLWELEETSSSILESSLPSNLQYLAAIYTTQSSLQYSFWLLVGGMCFVCAQQYIITRYLPSFNDQVLCSHCSHSYSPGDYWSCYLVTPLP